MKLPSYEAVYVTPDLEFIPQVGLWLFHTFAKKSRTVAQSVKH